MRLILLVGLIIAPAVIQASIQAANRRPISYSREVRPFLEKHCAPCHYGSQSQGGLSLASVARTLKGGNKGAAVIPGRPADSRLILLMEHRAEPKMPPIPGAKPLDTRLIRAWIQQGAKDDSGIRRPAPQAQQPNAASPADKRITAAAFSPNGKVLAVGGYDQVTLLDSARGKQLGVLRGHPGAVTSLAFSPDGIILFAGGGQPGKSGEIRPWDMSPLKTDRKWTPDHPSSVRRGHGDALYSVAVSPNGQLIAAGSYDQQVSLWHVNITKDPATSQPRYLKDHTDSVYSVAFSPDSKLLASAGGDRTVKVWSVQTGKRLYTLSESTADVYSVAFSPSGRQVAAGGADKTLRVWNVSPTGGKLAKAAFAHDGPILRVLYARDGRTILTSGQDRMVKRWDAATLAEKKVYPKQSDWPHALALSPNEKLLAVGRHDGSLAIYDADSGRLLREPLRAPVVAQNPASEPPSSSLIPGFRPGDNRRRPRKNGPITLVPASLNNISPSGVQRGKTVRLTLTGANVSDAAAVFFDDPAITGTIATPADRNRGVLRVDAKIADSARVGIHRVYVQAPNGVTGSVTFAVGAWPEVTQAEPNDARDKAQRLSLPATAVGAIDQAGDVDSYTVDARAGQEIVFEVIAQPIRSRLQPVLALLDPAGEIVARNRTIAGKTETIIGHRCRKDGAYTLQVSDYEGASGGDVFYRLNAGEFPVVTRVFPLGIQKGTTAEVTIDGFNLGGKTKTAVTAPPAAVWGQTTPLQVDTPSGKLMYSVPLAVGADPEAVASGTNTSLPSAQHVSVPVTINSRLDDPGKSDRRVAHYYRFPARKGEKLILEVLARRLGSRLDSEIEVLDSQGRPVERAVLRAVGQSELVLVDRDSSSVGLRLQAWDDFHVNDFILIGRELIQISRLPAGPDEDVFFRAFRGQRLGFLGTTPEFHSVAEPIYKVEVHPPGSTFSPNGFPLRKLYYVNDDGGPLYGKDSILEFTPPADGEYVVRLSDPRGQSGEEYPYRLMIHPPRPDFKLAMSPEHPNIPTAGAAVVEVTCERYDGFNGEIAISLEGLPPGIVATGTTIEAGETSAFLHLTADAGVAALPLTRPSSTRLVGRAKAGATEIVRTIEPDNGVRLLTVLPAPDINMTTDLREIAIRPGEEVYVEARVDRQGEFGNRVPVIVQNLPFGVRVTDIGLNGVLITEEEEVRRFTIYAEPWVKPQTRVFYVSGNVEGGVANAAPPLTIRVLPSNTVRSRVGASR